MLKLEVGSFYVSEDFYVIGFWFSTGSAGQSGSTANPVMSGTRTRELMAVYGRKESDSCWLKLIVKTNAFMKAASLC